VDRSSNEDAKIFERKVPFYKTIQRAESRKWMPAKETFDEYAIAKLAIIHQINLPVRDAIHLLISGIANSAIRASALLVADTTLEGFLEKMCAVRLFGSYSLHQNLLHVCLVCYLKFLIHPLQRRVVNPPSSFPTLRRVVPI